MEDFYDLLGVSDDAATDEIDRAWRERVHQYHPDVNDDTRANAQFKTLQTAHEVLSDGTERAAYDRLGHETYVRERLDGLPTAQHPSTGDRSGAGQNGPDGSGADGDADVSDRSEAAGRTRTDRSDSRDGGSGPAGTTGADSRERAGGAGTAGKRGARTATTSSAGRRKRPRRPLVYGWVGIAAASVVYALGLWSYFNTNTAALAALAEVPPAALPSLARAHDLVAPGTFTLNAAAAGAVMPVAFVGGAVGLGVGFLLVVAWFGRGTAYLYAVGGVAPVASLAIGPIVTAPDGVILVVTVVIPVVTVALFLVDVGRELLVGP